MNGAQTADAPIKTTLVILRRAIMDEPKLAHIDSQFYADAARSSGCMNVSGWRSSGAAASLFTLSQWGDEADARAFLQAIAETVRGPVNLGDGGAELRAVSPAGETWLHGLALQSFATAASS